MNQLQKTTNQITRILLEGLGKIEFQHLLHAFSHHPTALVSQRTCPLPGVIPVVTAGCVVLFQRLSHIWQTLVRLNECCIRRREHPHILEVDCAVCTFLTIVHGIKKKRAAGKKTPKTIHLEPIKAAVELDKSCSCRMFLPICLAATILFYFPEENLWPGAVHWQRRTIFHVDDGIWKQIHPIAGRTKRTWEFENRHELC